MGIAVADSILLNRLGHSKKPDNHLTGDTSDSLDPYSSFLSHLQLYFNPLSS